MSKPIAHLYIRVSDLNGGGGENLYTVDDQEEKARELASKRGYQVGEVVRDLECQAASPRRSADSAA
jgi:hypothetical protein